MGQLHKLFEPIKIGQMELKNRIIFLTVTSGYAVDDQVTPRLESFIAERAKGGAGLVMVGLLSPSRYVRPTPFTPGIYDDDLIPGLKRITDTIHSYGAKAGAQPSIQYLWAKDESTPLELVGPSDVVTRSRTSPRPLSVDEIEQLVVEFAEATRRARDAGFDTVEFHAGIGYLINRFLSPAYNSRSDRYGGSLENRLRFLFEIIAAAKERVGSDYPLMCRISAEEFMPGGHTLKESKKVASLLEEAGIAAINVQAGVHEAPVPLVQMSVPRGAFVYLAEEIKKVVTVPVVTAYRINDPVLAEQVVAHGKADLVGMARALIADPELPNKAKEGRLDEIRYCIACCRCLDEIFSDRPMICSVNAQAGREAEYTIEPTFNPKKVLVIGGGPAGLEAARVSALRGHRVSLYERADRLGGQLLLAAAPPNKEEIGCLTKYLCGEVERAGVEVKLGHEVNANSIVSAKPDVVLVATGARPIIPDLPRAQGENVVTALDVLSLDKEMGQRVVIIGGGMIGCETAEFLAEKGKRVTILEMLPRLAQDVGRTTRWLLLQTLKKAEVEMITNARAKSIEEKGVRVSRNGGEEFFEADTVVLAMGMKSNDELVRELHGKVSSLYSIGDCVEPRRIAEAIEGAFRVARQI